MNTSTCLSWSTFEMFIGFGEAEFRESCDFVDAWEALRLWPDCETIGAQGITSWLSLSFLKDNGDLLLSALSCEWLSDWK